MVNDYVAGRIEKELDSMIDRLGSTIESARRLQRGVESGEGALDTALTVIDYDIQNMRESRSYLRKLLRALEKNLREVVPVLRDVEKIHKEAQSILKRDRRRAMIDRDAEDAGERATRLLWSRSILKNNIVRAEEYLANIRDGVDADKTMRHFNVRVDLLREGRSAIQEVIPMMEDAIEEIGNSLRVMLKIQKQVKGMAKSGGRASYRPFRH